MNLPFLQMKWRELAKNETGHLSPVDWSWLEKKPMPSFDRLWKSEWSEDYEKVLRNVCGFNDDDINRTRYRMVMGALRYGLLNQVDPDKYSAEYYKDRLIKCLNDSTGNLEAVYDFANLLRIGAERYKITGKDIQLCLVILHDMRLACITENVPYVPVDRKDF